MNISKNSLSAERVLSLLRTDVRNFLMLMGEK